MRQSIKKIGSEMAQEETRKGPWTEQEDVQLVCFVGLFGDRRWDFVAKVSGLNRTGKSCRLRWVNYLHPGLKRGKMTPQEEKLVLELHAKWGNRWSRIARKLPGRTDNEIKNYWRTYTRKKAQEKKHAISASSPSASSATSPSASASSSSNSYSSSRKPQKDPLPFSESGEESFYGTGGPDVSTSTDKMSEEQHMIEGEYSMDDIWKEIALCEDNSIAPVSDGYSEETSNLPCPLMFSPTWGYDSGSPWQTYTAEYKMFPPIRDQLLPCDNALFSG